MKRMPINLTRLSETELDTILQGNMTPQMAANYLKTGRVSVRSFSQTLYAMYPDGDILTRIVDLYQISDPAINRRSLTKKIQNWLTDRNQPSDREDFFRIAFALRLSETELNTLLGICTGYTIQYRNSHELILSWFLRKGYGYPEAIEFLATLPQSQCEVPAPGGSKNLTSELYLEFQSIQTLDELTHVYLHNQGRFGHLHLRSFFYFDCFLNQLIHPKPLFNEEENDYSIDAVMDTYLSLHMPMGKKRGNYSLIQKLIKQNWPNATAIKNIRNRQEDVPRKLLLLLYVVTDNGFSDSYRESDEEYLSLADRVEDHWWTLNAMLSDCGMATLDPCNAFDWLILYAVAVDAEENMSERLEQVIAALYDDIKNV